MALANANPDGSIFRFFSIWQQAISPLSANSPSATLNVDFDESTNAGIVADIIANLSQYRIVLVNSVATLQKNGIAVTIAAPSALYSLQATILNGVPDATLRATIIALWNGTATAQQQQRALAYALLKLRQAGVI